MLAGGGRRRLGQPAVAENYLGYQRTDNFVAPNGSILETSYAYAAPTRLALNHWALSGDWTVKRGAIVLNQAGGRILYRFHARDLHLSPPAPGTPVVPGGPRRAAPGRRPRHRPRRPGQRHPTQPRLYQLIRQPGPVTQRTFEITFLDPGVQAYAFTFG